jgi:hypothetical protein
MVELITIYACIYIVIVVQRICPQAPKKRRKKQTMYYYYLVLKSSSNSILEGNGASLEAN